MRDIKRVIKYVVLWEWIKLTVDDFVLVGVRDVELIRTDAEGLGL